MSNNSLQAFVSTAAQRFTSTCISVRQFVDFSVYRAVLEHLRSNESAISVLSSPMFEQDATESLWTAWISRPHCRKIDHFRPLGSLMEISGGDEQQYWQAFPTEKRYHVIKAQAPQGDELTAPWPFFRTWLPPVIAELLDPSFIWEEPEGYGSDPIIGSAESMVWLGRGAITASLDITDWVTRGVGWSEAILPGDRCELVIDKATGILLRAQCLFRSKQVSVSSIESLSFDIAANPEFFKAHTWVGDDWTDSRIS